KKAKQRLNTDKFNPIFFDISLKNTRNSGCNKYTPKEYFSPHKEKYDLLLDIFVKHKPRTPTEISKTPKGNCLSCKSNPYLKYKKEVSETTKTKPKKIITI
ncbi:hypothetical protein NL393_30480, partial [Klebsiella pneumoniae]|nr:hypothetical protein [Klebsiella pneumoniae]